MASIAYSSLALSGGFLSLVLAFAFSSLAALLSAPLFALLADMFVAHGRTHAKPLSRSLLQSLGAELRHQYAYTLKAPVPERIGQSLRALAVRSSVVIEKSSAAEPWWNTVASLKAGPPALPR
jgi:hypothetical protein